MSDNNVEHFAGWYSFPYWKDKIPNEIQINPISILEGSDPISFIRLQKAKVLLEERCKVYELESDTEFIMKRYSLDGNIKAVYKETNTSNNGIHSIEISANSDREVIKFAKTLGLNI